MKKTTSINMGGVVFHIDEDAYQILNDYITSLEKHFEKDPEKTEILNDIEQRIAELLSEELPDKGQAVKKEHVEKIKSIMGNPKDFDTENAGPANEQASEDKKPRQLYRNPDGKVLGGVAGGLGVYLGIDPALIRVAFVLLTFFGAGFPIPLYIILWIIIPEAVTRTQKMEMKGESITIDTIKKNAQTGFEEIKTSVRDFANSKDTQNAVSQIGSFIGRVAPIFFRVVFGLTIGAIVTAIIILLVIDVSPSMVCWSYPPSIDPDVLYIMKRVDVYLFAVGVLLIASAAVTYIFYILPNAIWGSKTTSRIGIQLSSVLTTIGIIVIIIALTKSVVDYQAVKEFIFYGGGN